MLIYTFFGRERSQVSFESKNLKHNTTHPKNKTKINYITII